MSRADERQLSAQLTSWQLDIQCIENELPTPSRSGHELDAEGVLDENQRYAEPGEWPVLDAARMVGARPALSAAEVAAAEEHTMQFLAAFHQSRAQQNGPPDRNAQA